MSVLIKGGLIVTSTGRYVADVYADGDKIKTIGIDLDNPADEVVDASGKYVLPGAIDPHTHIAMPFMGTYAQDDYETGTIAAACGGVTTLVDFDLQQEDVAARGNFCTLDSNRNILDRRAGRLPNEEAIPVVDILKTIQLPGVEIEVKHLKEYRFTIVMRGEGLSDQLADTDPQQTGVPRLKVKAEKPEAEKAAGLFQQLLE